MSPEDTYKERQKLIPKLNSRYVLANEINWDVETEQQLDHIGDVLFGINPDCTVAELADLVIYCEDLIIQMINRERESQVVKGGFINST